MSDATHKPPLVPMVIGTTIIVIVMYALSVGPAAWILNRPAAWILNSESCPAWLDYTMLTIYAPLEYAADNGPKWLHDAVYAYVQWWQSNSAPAASI